MRYAESLDEFDGLDVSHVRGFFDGWPFPPSEETFLRILRGSAHVVLAVDEESGEVVGFITAISDGVLSAFIPLLEVRRDRRGTGIGSELVRRMLAKLDDLYMVDLTCDAGVQPFYERLGMQRFTAMVRRNYERASKG